MCYLLELSVASILIAIDIAHAYVGMCVMEVRTLW